MTGGIQSADAEDRLFDYELAISVFKTPEKLNRYLRMFIDLYSDWRSEIERLEDKPEALAAYLHKLAGAANGVGLVRLGNLARRIENVIKDQEPYLVQLSAVSVCLDESISELQTRLN